MKFFDSFWKASFYQEGKTTSFWKAFWKIIVISFLLSSIYAGVFYVTVGKNIPTYIQKYSAQALDGYPKDLVLTVKDGKLTKNILGVVQLYPLSDEIHRTSKEEALPTYLLTINDSEPVSFESYRKADSFVLLAKDGAVSKGKNGIEMQPYSKMSKTTKDFTFDKSVIVAVTDKIHEYESRISWIIMGGVIVLGTLFLPQGLLLATLLYGLVIMWLSTWIMKRKATYSESYIISLYALAPVVLIISLLQIIPYIMNVLNHIPFLTLLGIIVFLKYMFTKTGKQEAVFVKRGS